MDILSTLSQFQTLFLQAAEPLPVPLSLQEAERRLAQRQQLQALLQTLEKLLNELPVVPDPKGMAWASALLTQQHLLILEVDTTGLDRQAELLRLLLLQRDGSVAFDRLCRPTLPPAVIREALVYNGLTEEQVEQAAPLEEVWPAFLQQAQGRLLVSWNWEWDQEQLVRGSRRLGQERPILLGMDLQEPARTFFSQPYAGLPTLCRLIGAPLPQPATGLDRARGQLAILQAMAEGRLGPGAAAPPAAGDAFEDLDDRDDSQPF